MNKVAQIPSINGQRFEKLIDPLAMKMGTA